MATAETASPTVAASPVPSAFLGPSCLAGALAVRADGRPGDTQDVGILLTITNGTSPCSLTGTPQVTATTSSGDTIRVPSDPLASALPPSAGHVELAVGGRAFVKIRIPEDCALGANQGPPYYTRLTVTISSRDFHVSGLSLPARCGFIFVSPYYGGG